jgi:ribose 1,5-bisphosphokinase PhnN
VAVLDGDPATGAADVARLERANPDVRGRTVRRVDAVDPGTDCLVVAVRETVERAAATRLARRALASEADAAADLAVVETSLSHGSGLGPWLVHWMAVRSGGSVRFEPHGTRVVV